MIVVTPVVFTFINEIIKIRKRRVVLRLKKLKHLIYKSCIGNLVQFNEDIPQNAEQIITHNVTISIAIYHTIITTIQKALVTTDLNIFIEIVNFQGNIYSRLSERSFHISYNQNKSFFCIINEWLR